jgi:hypothetical protein
MAVIDLNPSLRASGETHTKDVGGGTWTYGWNLTTGGKHCFSNYFHGSKMASATARIAGSDNKSVEAKGITAKANKTAGSAYTCYAYWGVYANFLFATLAWVQWLWLPGPLWARRGTWHASRDFAVFPSG